MSDRTLHISIVTPSKTAFEGSAVAVSVPGSYSPFQVLYNHAPIISSLDIGVLAIEDADNHLHYYASREGFIEVMKNEVTIVVQDLVHASEIDGDRAESDLANSRVAADSGEKSGRDQARTDVHWAEARLRALKLQREHA